MPGARLASILLLLALPLVACGSTTSNDSAPTTSGAGATASVTPVLLTKSEAAARYLKLVAPTKAAHDKLKLTVTGKDGVTAENVGAFTREAGAYSGSLRTFSLGLQSTAWPADIQTAADATISEVVEVQTAWRAVAESTDVVQVSMAVVNVPSSVPKSELLRQKLGLPQAS